jgi:hypothetical protein
MADQDKPMNDDVLKEFGITAEDVEVVPESDWEPAPNGITDDEIEQIAGPYGSAILDRLRDAAFSFNLGLYMNQIETPWRQLLEEFRNDLELNSTLRPLTLPDGSQQMVVVDAGKFPGHPKLRECLWGLHEALEGIENYDASANVNGFVKSAVGRLGGRSPQHNEEDIKAAIQAVKAKNHSDTLDIIKVQAWLRKKGKPIPGRSTIYIVNGKLLEGR